MMGLVGHKSRWSCWRVLGLIVAIVVMVATGCASGVEEEQNGDDDSNIRAEQNHGNDDPSGNDDPADVGVPIEDSGDNGGLIEDTGINDGEPDDAGSNDGGPCDGVQCGDKYCDPDSGECVDCLTGEHCGDTLVCDAVAQSCVGCVDATDCPGDDVCNLEPQVCVQCVDATDCPGADVCDPVEFSCVECVDANDCPGDDVCDPVARRCVECVARADCSGDDVCDETAQVCVDCVDTPDCSGNDVCDQSAQVCVECVGDGDCPGSGRCITSQQVCVDCLGDGDCGGDLTCDTAQNVCVGCVVDTDCGSEQVCDDETCVDCVVDGDCGFGLECNQAANECEMIGECVESANCVAEDVCDTSTFECVECLSDQECGDGLECNLSTNECDMVGECIEDGHCTGEDVCDTSTYECVECVGDDECDDGFQCDQVANECELSGECADDEHCSDGDVCDTSVYECVECLGDGDCEGSWLCDESAQMCVECFDDDDCDGSWVCYDSVALCVECMEDQDCPHQGQQCFSDYNACSAPCCDFEKEVAYADSSGHYRGYNVVVDSAGNAVVGIADRDNNHIILAERDGGGWATQVVEALESIDTISALDIALDADDNPHMILANQEELTHFWREGTTWNSELLDEAESGSYRGVRIVIDEQGTVHMAAEDTSSESDFFYAWQESDGSRGEEDVVLEGGSTNWIELDVYSDGIPVIVATMTGATGEIYVLERIGTGQWIETALGQISHTGATMAVDADDDLWVLANTSFSAVLWHFSGGQWTEESVPSNFQNGPFSAPEHGIGIDGFNEPHFITFGEEYLFYYRRENGDWIEYQALDYADNLEAPRMTVGPVGRPHVVVRHWTDQEIHYFTTQQ